MHSQLCQKLISVFGLWARLVTATSSASYVVYIDPYLSNSVQEKEDSRMRRLLPVPVLPQNISDADCIVITHVHQDHCDENTLLAVSQASPNAIFIGPVPVCIKLSNAGIAESRLVAAKEAPIRSLLSSSSIPVPSSHPEIEYIDVGGWASIGYIFEYFG